MQNTAPPPPQPLDTPVDVLLADIAIRIQLSRTDYGKAVQRYQAVSDWIERPNSPLCDRVQILYPQGSMATGSTIASRLRTDEFDIDIAAQLDLPPAIAPRTALDLLYEAVRGEPESRYHRMAKRRTRCVTVDYSDDMHLDVTPMLRLRGTPERESHLYHHRPETPQEPGYRCVANPYGFAQWFRAKTPPELDFAAAYATRSLDHERAVLMARADSEPVPDQTPPFQKSRAVVVLQLLKRWRNVQYDRRPGRRPPSIMIAKLIADNANATHSLSEELLHQAKRMLAEFQRSHDARQPIHVTNPVCPEDVLTDRWPGTLATQGVFVEDLQNLVAKVGGLIAGRSLDDMKRIMVELFGETPTADAFRAFNQRTGNDIRLGRSRHVAAVGGIATPGIVAGGSRPVVSDRPTPRHTFYGNDRIR
jgi:hypothetical protein